MTAPNTLPAREISPHEEEEEAAKLCDSQSPVEYSMQKKSGSSDARFIRNYLRFLVMIWKDLLRCIRETEAGLA